MLEVTGTDGQTEGKDGGNAGRGEQWDTEQGKTKDVVRKKDQHFKRVSKIKLVHRYRYWHLYKG